MATCTCSKALERSFASVRDAVTVAVEKDEIENGADLLAVSQDKWMAVYRCRTCGTLWAEACYSSGHMDLFYLFPVPPTDDPVRWLHEEAAELPSGHDYLRPSS